MSFIPGSGTLSGSSDVALNSPGSNQLLIYDTSVQKWKNGTVAISAMPAGTTLTVFKANGVWPVRPTSRTDIVVHWRGPDPSPPIISSGTGGMLDNVDVRLITP